MLCAQCQRENRPQARFCEECGAPLTRSCRNCGTQLSASAKFCSECAHPVAEPGTEGIRGEGQFPGRQLGRLGHGDRMAEAPVGG